MIKKTISIILAFMLCAGFSVSVVTADSGQPSSWAVDLVNTAIEADLVPLSLQTQFTQATTRAEFCALAVALYENVMGEIEGRKTFVDTDDENVEKMAAVGVVSGVDYNRFAPDDTLTREQAAVMLSRLAEAMGMRLYALYSSFDDNENISEWALREVGQIQFAGIMSGVGNNTFLPKGNYTREQSIITILRLFNAFQLGTVSISYDANGGGGTPSGHEIHIAPSVGGDEFDVIWRQIVYEIPNKIPTKSGYIFRGWTSDYYPDLDIYNAGGLFDAIGIHVVDGLAITLSAVWVDVVEKDFSNRDITSELLVEMVESGEIPANVTDLRLGNNELKDINALSGLNNLTTLVLERNQINEISSLSNLTYLELLDLRDNQIADITPIAGLTGLTRLHLSDNPITAITPLSGFINLSTLDLQGNQIEDLSPLAGLSNLEELSLNRNSISDISLLAGYTKLRFLQINSNKISDITYLSVLTELSYLDLGNNEIDDINALRHLTNLEILLLNDNKINDASLLCELNNLISLWLHGNPISENQIAELRAKLPDTDIQ